MVGLREELHHHAGFMPNWDETQDFLKVRQVLHPFGNIPSPTPRLLIGGTFFYKFWITFPLSFPTLSCPVISSPLPAISLMGCFVFKQFHWIRTNLETHCVPPKRQVLGRCPRGSFLDSRAPPALLALQVALPGRKLFTEVSSSPAAELGFGCKDLPSGAPCRSQAWLQLTVPCHQVPPCGEQLHQLASRWSQ